MIESLVQLQPFDTHNRMLREQVHPPSWINPTPKKTYHLVVVGAGTAGLVTAAGAAGLGARVALVERELMGGDCLNVGCVPSKGIIRAGRVAATVRDASDVGVISSSSIDFAAVMERMRRLRAQISPADSAERFRGLGVDVFFGKGQFADEQTIHVVGADGTTTGLNFKKAVIATGARAAAPPIPGLDDVPYLTNETLFSLTERPPRLGVIGSGPIGCEMAQTFARLGSQVHLFEQGDHVLMREDPDAAAIVQRQFVEDGVRLVLNSSKMQLTREADSICVSVQQQGEALDTRVDSLLVAVGRAPNIDELNLDVVGVDVDRGGIKVNDYLQSSNPRIYAAGDVCSAFKFTHAADFQARIVIQNSMFALGPFGRKNLSDLIIPWATYTTPEVAHVGMSERDAQQAGVPIDTYFQSLAHVDRAILEGQEEGFVKVHTKKGRDEIVGATIVAENAGDMISELTLAMKNKIGLAGIGATIHPYPTQAEAIRKLGDQYNRTKLTPVSKKLLGLLRAFNVGS